jgi:hypothetical protein
MMVIRALAVSLILLAFQSGLSPQQPQVTVLRTSSSRLLSVPSFVWSGSPQCDEKGDIFFRLVPADFDAKASVVLRLNLATESPTIFQLPSELSTTTALMEFSITRSGRVWFLDESKDGGHIVFGFNSNGDLNSRINIDTPKNLLANRFSVADDGIILVGGYYPEWAGGDTKGKTYLGIFDNSGTLRKAFARDSLQEFDLEAAKSHIVENSVAAGSDGNFYFLQGDEIVVISEWGEFVRKLKVQRFQKSTLALRLDLSEGLISLEFYEEGEGGFLINPMFLIIDSATGEPYSRYSMPDGLETGITLGFSRRSGYTFSTLEQDRIKITTAPLR